MSAGICTGTFKMKDEFNIEAVRVDVFSFNELVAAVLAVEIKTPVVITWHRGKEITVYRFDYRNMTVPLLRRRGFHTSQNLLDERLALFVRRLRKLPKEIRK